MSNARVMPTANSVPEVERRSVLALLAMADGWHQRAAVLRHLSFDVREMFVGDQARWDIRRLGGGSGRADEATIAAISAELADAAETARAEAERLINLVIEVAGNVSIPNLAGSAPVVATATAMEAPDLDHAVVARPVKPASSPRAYMVVTKPPRI